MMRFELDLPPPPSSRLYISALTIGLSYFLGGLIPLVPYFFCDTARGGLIWSCVLTGVILLVFGVVKSMPPGPCTPLIWIPVSSLLVFAFVWFRLFSAGFWWMLCEIRVLGVRWWLPGF